MGKVKDYTKVCWYCKAEAMRDEGSYYVCQKCGATYNPVPKVAPQEFTTELLPGSKIKVAVLTKRFAKRIKKQREGK